MTTGSESPTVRLLAGDLRTAQKWHGVVLCFHRYLQHRGVFWLFPLWQRLVWLFGGRFFIRLVGQTSSEPWAQRVEAGSFMPL